MINTSSNENGKQYTDLLERVVCNQCGSDDFSVVYPPRYHLANPDEITNSFRSSGDEILIDQLVQCNTCRLQYLNPRLRQDLILDAYSAGTDEIFVSQVEGRERTFSRCLDIIERFAPGKGDLLDIGTAGGSFLSVAQKRGWQVSGCEPNRWLADWGKQNYGVHIHPGTIFDMQLNDGSFDVVTLWDVLEHTPDPKAVLQECYRILKPGGILVINYPDIQSLVARLMGRRWVFLLSVHLYYFTYETLGAMFQKMGFGVISRSHHWQFLEVGYIFFRMKSYTSFLAGQGSRIVNVLRLNHAQIPYWMGQELVIARKQT
jgi:2-polyprenyl-3-methyl-5-hydroxy-6-metoxy-1,4-benzoquinol methylase